MARKRVAVVLCGSGFQDGSEIRESVGVLWALSKEGADAQCFAPDAPQADVINSLSGQPAAGESRNMLVESARIARGEVLPLGKLNPNEFDGLILPGGFGAAKNLCDFAQKGANGAVRPELAKILGAMHAVRKPIGGVCIAPAILALAFKGKNLTLTVGETSEASQEIEKLGHRHEVCRTDACVVDAKNKIVTTPAYMDGQAPLHKVFSGIEALVKETLRLTDR